MISKNKIRTYATELGFDLFGIVSTATDAPHHNAFLNWLERGAHGEMSYLARDSDRRRNPTSLFPACRSIIMLGVSYDQLSVPAHVLSDPARGRIARYAWGLDYHDVLVPRLRALGDLVTQSSRSYVDTGALLERDWAEQAGLGFVGKNTCIINRDRGSYLFLGAVLLDDDVEESKEAPNKTPATGCGHCTRCLTACPTSAFTAAYQLDARKCISYLTIELKGAIPELLRPQMGNWIFGCDICQDVCPYVRRIERNRLVSLPSVDSEVAAPRLKDVLSLDQASFRARFKATPIMRAKRRGLLRNACVAAANYGKEDVIPALRNLLDDSEPLLRTHAQWALTHLTGSTNRTAPLTQG